MTSLLGKVVKSNSHTDYVCQVYGKHEVPEVPSNADHAFGTFVLIDLSQDNHFLIGVIYDTILVNPDFGRLGPRLSPESDLEIFSPDYLNERAVLIGILVIGEARGDEIRQGMPTLAANSDALVHPMIASDIRTFHTSAGQLRLAYLPQIVQRSDPLARQLALTVLGNVSALMPEFQAVLGVIADDLSWQLQVNTMGTR